jgi:uncharacterized membrane protein YcjF (UPF0283 family)
MGQHQPENPPMRRATHALWILYTALAVGLLGAALTAYQHHQWPGTAFFAAAAIGLGVAVTHTSWLLDEYRHLLARADADNRALARTNAEDDAVRIAVAAASCCDRSWSTAGTEHDPEHCTRKDQTT